MRLCSCSCAQCVLIVSSGRTAKQQQCDVAVNGNSGCGVALTVNAGDRFSSGDNSYGPAFNAGSGGYYAMERTTDKILVWFWPRSGGAPSTVTSPGNQLDTAIFVSALTDTHRATGSILSFFLLQGMPSAAFPSSNCDIQSHFGAHNIIINLALCASTCTFARSFAF